LTRKGVSKTPVVYLDSGRLFISLVTSLPIGTMILKDSIVKYSRIITSSKVQFTPAFGGLLESNKNFSLGRLVEGRFVTVYDITSQLFDPASLISNGDRKIGILGEIECIFTALPIDLGSASFKIPLLATKMSLEPKYEDYTVVPENWDERAEEESSVSAADKDQAANSDSDLDFFEFETTPGNIFESEIDNTDNDFTDLTDVSFKPSTKRGNTRQRVRFTESYCNIVKTKLNREESALSLQKVLSRYPKWFESYVTRYFIENSRQIINKYSSVYSETPSDAIRIAVNRSISILCNFRYEHMYSIGDKVKPGMIDDLELLVKKNRIYKKDCFYRFFRDGRDETIQDYYPNSSKIFFDTDEVQYDEL
jgi:hypothetical protein